MTMPRSNQSPRVPTPPRGDEIASYATYLEAQQAVDYLSDHKFPVEQVTIVGTDLRMVERVTGRLTYGRIATAGLFSGAWFGLLFGLLLVMMSAGAGYVLLAMGMGAGFGLLFSVISYAFTRGKRDFASSSQIVASKYAILCEAQFAGEARSLLVQMGGAGVSAVASASSGWGQPDSHRSSQWGQPAQPQQPGAATAPAGAATQPEAAARPADPAPRRVTDPRWTTPDGKPRYGAMRPEAGGAEGVGTAVSDAPGGAEGGDTAAGASDAPAADTTATDAPGSTGQEPHTGD